MTHDQMEIKVASCWPPFCISVAEDSSAYHKLLCATRNT